MFPNNKLKKPITYFIEIIFNAREYYNLLNKNE